MSRSPADTPLMRQYLDVKDKHPDALVLFRLGDFYEMFFEDAVLGSRLLDLTLSTRDKGKEDAVPMCGVPHHAARGYIAKLTELGHRVVMVEQVEDPRLAKGLVKREVARIITPGVMLDDEVLEPKLPRYLAALVAEDKTTFGLAFLDATTGELRATSLALGEVIDELVRVAPREIRVEPKQLAEGAPLAPIRARYRTVWNAAPVPAIADAKAVLSVLGQDVGVGVSVGVGDSGSGARRASRSGARAVDLGSPTPTPTPSDAAMRAAATVLSYARATQPTGTLPVTRLITYVARDAVVLDEAAIANLELVETLIGKKTQGSLLDVIDQTVTAPGGRLLRRWLLYPLVDVAQIRRRQDAVAWLVGRPALSEQLRRALSRIADLERLAGKATLGIATPRDLGRLRDALGQLPAVVALIGPGATKLDPVPDLLGLRATLAPELAAMAARLAKALVDDPPPLLKDGGAIRTGYDPTVDECRGLADGGKTQILAIEEREQRTSGISSLRIRYNRVFGYYIEITKSHLAKVPAHYARKQTISSGERFVTPELAELEHKQEIVLLRRAVPGGANKSYGSDVARLAGLPKQVIGRARDIMQKLEGGQDMRLGGSAQLSLLTQAAPSPLLAKLAAIDPNHTTPLQALQLLAELKALV